MRPGRSKKESRPSSRKSSSPWTDDRPVRLRSRETMPIIIDAHSDILNDIHPRRLLGEKAVLERHWMPKMRKGRIELRVVAIFTEPPLLPELALRRGLDLVASLYEDISESPSCVLCRTCGDIRKAKEAGKIGLILGMEGAEPLGTDIQLLRIFYELG